MKAPHAVREKVRKSLETAKKEINNICFLVRRTAYREIAKKQTEQAMLLLIEGTKSDDSKWVRIQCCKSLLNHYTTNPTAIATIAKALRKEEDLFKHLRRLMEAKRGITEEAINIMEKISKTKSKLEGSLVKLLSLI